MSGTPFKLNCVPCIMPVEFVAIFDWQPLINVAALGCSLRDRSGYSLLGPLDYRL